jgi:hypothetical protein
MPFTLVDLLYGGVVPAVVGMIVWWLARRVLQEDAAARYAASLAVAAGVLAGYWLVWWKEDHGRWLPKMPYDWLPMVIAAAGIIGPVVLARGVSRVERGVVYLVFGLVAVWILLPTRASVLPQRPWYAAGLGPALAVLAILFDGVCERFGAALVAGVTAFCAMCAAAILLLSGSTSFALTAGSGAAALAGIAVAASRSREATCRGAALVCCVLLGGAMLVGKFNTLSAVPPGCYVVPALAPLLLWGAVRGPLSGGGGFAVGSKQVVLPVAASVIAVVVAAIESSGGGE